MNMTSPTPDWRSDPYSDRSNPFSPGPAMPQVHRPVPAAWQPVDNGMNNQYGVDQQFYSPFLSAHEPSYSTLTTVGIMATIAGLLSYILGVFLPFISAQHLVVAVTGEALSGSFATSNVFASHAPAYASVGAAAVAVIVLIYIRWFRRRDDVVGQATLAGVGLLAGSGLLIFAASVYVDTELGALYAMHAQRGIGQGAMLIGAALALFGAFLLSVGIFRANRRSSVGSVL